MENWKKMKINFEAIRYELRKNVIKFDSNFQENQLKFAQKFP